MPSGHGLCGKEQKYSASPQPLARGSFIRSSSRVCGIIDTNRDATTERTQLIGGLCPPAVRSASITGHRSTLTCAGAMLTNLAAFSITFPNASVCSLLVPNRNSSAKERTEVARGLCPTAVRVCASGTIVVAVVCAKLVPVGSGLVLVASAGRAPRSALIADRDTATNATTGRCSGPCSGATRQSQRPTCPCAVRAVPAPLIAAMSSLRMNRRRSRPLSTVGRFGGTRTK